MARWVCKNGFCDVFNDEREIDVKYSIVPRFGVIDCNVDEEENRKYLGYDACCEECTHNHSSGDYCSIFTAVLKAQS